MSEQKYDITGAQSADTLLHAAEFICGLDTNIPSQLWVRNCEVSQSAYTQKPSAFLGLSMDRQHVGPRGEVSDHALVSFRETSDVYARYFLNPSDHGRYETYRRQNVQEAIGALAFLAGVVECLPVPLSRVIANFGSASQLHIETALTDTDQERAAFIDAARTVGLELAPNEEDCPPFIQHMAGPNAGGKLLTIQCWLL